MGKLKKRSRSSKHRVNPLNRNKRIKEDNSNDPVRASKIVPLIAKLSASTPNERSMALGSISVLADEPKYRKLLLKERLLQILFEKTLKDDNDEIIVEAFGLLRNLVIEEGYDVSIYLWRQNIWKEIEENLEKAKRSLDSLINESKNEKIGTALLFDYLENLISLIVGLGDSSEDIFEQIFSKIDPIMKLIKEILTFGIDLDNKNLKISINLLNSIFDLIYNFSSESIEFTRLLINKYEFNFEILNKFVNEISRSNELTKIYLQGIGIQLLDLDEDSNKNQSFYESLQQIFLIIKDIDINTNREILLKEIDNNAETYNINLKKKIQSRSKFQAIELSIELITAIIEYIAFEDNSLNESFECLIEYFSGTILNLLVSLLDFNEFKSSSLSALNNLFWLFNKIGFRIENSKEVFNKILNLKDVEIEDKINIFGILWALIDDDIEIEENIIDEIITEFEKISNEVEIENELKDQYLTRLVGFLGSLAKRQGNIQRNAKISKFLLNLLDSLPKISTILVIEILDIFYEIFCDGEFDYDLPVFVDGDYLNKLQELKPAIKTSIKLIDKNKNKILKERGDEVFNNLSRFIEYKKSER